MATHAPLVELLVAEDSNLPIPTIPPLENGDRLTRAEFEQRYEAMPELKKAELIERTVHVTSPVRTTHSERHAWVNWWLVSYRLATQGIEVHDNVSVRLDADNEVQPDVLIRQTASGATGIAADGYLEGPPELIVEIAGSSASYDLHAKLAVYRRTGVQEYLVWRVYEGALDWFALTEGQYQPLAADNQGVIRSAIFPGLWLHVPAMLRGDLAAVLATLHDGLASRDATSPYYPDPPADTDTP